MKLVRLLVIVLSFSSISLGDDTPPVVNKPGVLSNDPAVLKGMIRDQDKQIAQLKAEISKLKAPSTTTNPSSKYPSLAGIWIEGDNQIVVSQTDADFKADCFYKANEGDVRWVMRGTITQDGKIKGVLQHTQAPKGWILSQSREGQVSKDGNQIAGIATFSSDPHPFSWRRKEIVDAAELQSIKDASSEKKVVLLTRDYKLLPTFKKVISKSPGPINFSTLGSWSADGTPMGFTNSEINSIGYINAARVVRIIDDSSALIEVSLVDPTTDLPADVNGGTPIKRTLLIEGVPTKGQAEDNFWKLESWFKVIDTKKLDGTTYFVVWQVLQAGRASTK